MSAPSTQILSAVLHHRAVSPEIHGLSSPLGLEPITSTHISSDCAPLDTPTKEVYITSSQMSGSSGPFTSQTTPKAMPRISQEPSEELMPVPKKLQESLPVVIWPDTCRGRGGCSSRRFEAVHLTSPEVVKERRHLLEEKERKEKEKKERAAERLKQKTEKLCEVIGKAKRCLEKKTGETTKKKKAPAQKEKKTDKPARKKKATTPTATPKKDALTRKATAMKKTAITRTRAAAKKSKGRMPKLVHFTF